MAWNDPPSFDYQQMSSTGKKFKHRYVLSESTKLGQSPQTNQFPPPQTNQYQPSQINQFQPQPTNQFQPQQTNQFQPQQTNQFQQQQTNYQHFQPQPYQYSTDTPESDQSAQLGGQPAWPIDSRTQDSNPQGGHIPDSHGVAWNASTPVAHEQPREL